MLEIRSDDTEIEKRLVRLCGLIEGAGGYFSPDTALVAEKGNLSIQAKGEARGKEPIMRIPHLALLPYEEFSLGVQGNDIVIRSCVEGVTDLRRALMEETLALYNLGGKMALHKRLSPWMNFKEDTGLHEFLMRARQDLDTDEVRAGLEGRTSSEDFVLATFFKNRFLSCRLFKKEAPQKRVVMPVMDAFNHHFRGASYHNAHSEESPDTSSLCLRQMTPVAGSRECYARYGRLDTLDSYLHYSFADTSGPLVRSIPLTIDLGPAGHIKINAMNSEVPRADIPDPLKDMHIYVPIVNVYHAEKRAELSHIFIPQAPAPRTLRRLLDLIIALMAPEMGEIERFGCVLRAEDIILTENLNYYDQIRGMLNEAEFGPSDSFHMLESVVKIQKEKILAYQNIQA